MESLSQFIFEHAHQAHWIVFSALILAGFSLPISEDLLIIFSGVIAATIVPENTTLLFLGVFVGCYLSDWICYWVGRIMGPKLWSIRWFARTVDRNRLDQFHHFYEKYGFWTLIIGRFIPFGVRNCLFLTAGMGRMNFGKFILSDGIACLLSNTTLFTLSYYAGRNYEELFSYLKAFNILIFAVFVVSIIGLIWYKRRTPADTK